MVPEPEPVQLPPTESLMPAAGTATAACAWMYVTMTASEFACPW